MIKYKFTLAIFILLCTKMSYSQTQQSVSTQLTLPSILMLEISNSSPLSINLQLPSIAGAPFGSSTTDNSKWLNFTSAVPPNVTRNISAQIISGSAPSGFRLKLQTSAIAVGTGILGSPITTVYPNSTPQNLITGIGGSYTGVGVGNGYNLTFSVEILDYSSIRNITSSLTITYTIADN
jgi:hypothetical protein